jgi:ribosomal protein L11 methyltransferase
MGMTRADMSRKFMTRQGARHSIQAPPAPSIWVVAFEVPKSAAPGFDGTLAEIGDTHTCFESGADGERWQFDVFVAGAEPPRGAIEAILGEAAQAAGIPLPKIAIAPLPETDWLAENRKAFPPVSAGRFFVYGSYFEGRVPPGRVGIALDAGLAFGSGSHESTRLALLALDALGRRRRYYHPLDLGTGSGILAIAMASTWRVKVASADIDPVAVKVAQANAQRNRVASRVRPVESDGLAARVLAAQAPYDLIVANILARPLVRMAPQLAAALTHGGRIVLSGILTEQAAGVAAAYRIQGLALKRRLTLGLWTALVLGRA